MCFKKIFYNQHKINYDDTKFLDCYVESFYLLNSNKIAFIKNLHSEYIACTQQFSELVGMKSISELIYQRDINVQCTMSKFYKLYLLQENNVFKFRNNDSYLEVQEFATGLGMYIFSKSPIVNPTTNNVVGILVNVEQMRAPSMLEIILQINKSKAEPLKPNFVNYKQKDKISLGTKQLDVLFCLSIGLKEDKEIAEFISSFSHTEINHNCTKSIIQDLFKKFNVNTRSQLMESIIREQVHTLVPGHFIKIGSYKLSESHATIKH